MTPKLSFIIPTLNEEKILESTLNSIRKLKAFPFEIIISDGNSSDKTLDIARRLADTVVVWEKPTRQTIAMARNMGAAAAVGEYFVYLDADVFIPDMDAFFNLAVRRFVDDPELSALTVWRSVLPEYRRMFDRANFFILCAGAYVMNRWLRMPVTYGEFMMMRTSTFKAVGGFNSSLVAVEDTDMFMRLAKVGKTRLAPELTIFETGRRVHKMGWPRAWYLWITTGISARWFDKQLHEEWKVVR